MMGQPQMFPNQGSMMMFPGGQAQGMMQAGFGMQNMAFGANVQNGFYMPQNNLQGFGAAPMGAQVGFGNNNMNNNNMNPAQTPFDMFK